MDSPAGAEPDAEAGRVCLDVLLAGSGVGSLVVLYARYYMSAADPVPRFFSFFLAFMGPWWAWCCRAT